MNEQLWIDEVQKIVRDFIQNDQQLAELMLDRCERYWEACFEAGSTPHWATRWLHSQIIEHGK